MFQEQEERSDTLKLEELAVLYNAGRYFSYELKKKMGLMVEVPIYIQDPFVAEQVKQAADAQLAARAPRGLLDKVNVPCELELHRGPTNSRIAVVDYDADTNQLAQPVEWDSKKHRFYFKDKNEKIFLEEEHCDLPQFHQVNVWAIVQEILSMYEDSAILGRYVPWAFDGNRILLVPHAGEMQNAFYSRNSKSIQFYYFNKNKKRIFTCLSHDIIAHETGHAVLDGLRPYYIEDSSIQTSAFHEFVADLTAIQAAFLNNTLRFQAAQASGGDMTRDQVISGLAEEFGYYSYGRPFLRSAQDPRDMQSVQNSMSQYDWSLVMTGAMFDILKEMLAIRMVKPKKSGVKPTLKESFMFVCNRFRRVAFQPLDYLPPVDVQFSDYARAVLRADEIVTPSDEDGYREAMRNVFDRRGIDWTEEDTQGDLHFYAYDINQITRSRTDAYHFLNNNRRQLCIPEYQDFSVVDLYQTDKMAWGIGKLPREIVIQYVWREDVELKGSGFGRFRDEHASLLCGGTLIFDSRGNVLSWQRKPGTGKQETGRRARRYCKDEMEKGNQRREQLLDHLRKRISRGAVGLKEDVRPDMVGDQAPVVASRGVDGSLHFGITPHLRHWSEG